LADLAGGDRNTLIDSIIQKILVYDNDFQVFPGHYDATSVGDENGEYISPLSSAGLVVLQDIGSTNIE
jgi:hypothetical protein